MICFVLLHANMSEGAHARPGGKSWRLATNLAQYRGLGWPNFFLGARASSFQSGPTTLQGPEVPPGAGEVYSFGGGIQSLSEDSVEVLPCNTIEYVIIG